MRWIQPNYFKLTSIRLKLRSTTFSFIHKWPCPCLTQPFRHIVWEDFFYVGKNSPSLIDTVNSELPIIVSWLSVNIMSLTIEKHLIWYSDQGTRNWIQETKLSSMVAKLIVTWLGNATLIMYSGSQNIFTRVTPLTITVLPSLFTGW